MQSPTFTGQYQFAVGLLDYVVCVVIPVRDPGARDTIGAEGADPSPIRRST